MTAALAVASTVLVAGSAQADDPANPGYDQLQVYVPSDAKSFSVVTRTPNGQNGHISKCIDKGNGRRGEGLRVRGGQGVGEPRKQPCCGRRRVAWPTPLGMPKPVSLVRRFVRGR
jgi:hypothetical protein